MACVAGDYVIIYVTSGLYHYAVWVWWHARKVLLRRCGGVWVLAAADRSICGRLPALSYIVTITGGGVYIQHVSVCMCPARMRILPAHSLSGMAGWLPGSALRGTSIAVELYCSTC